MAWAGIPGIFCDNHLTYYRILFRLHRTLIGSKKSPGPSRWLNLLTMLLLLFFLKVHCQVNVFLLFRMALTKLKHIP